MRGFVILLLVIGAIYWGGRAFLKDRLQDLSLDTLISGGPESMAKDRVKQILGGLEKEGDGNGLGLQAAICQWDSGLNVIQDEREFEAAYDAFSVWRDQFDINHRKIKSYEITGAEVLQKEPPVVMVTGTIEDRPFKLKVPYKRRLTWES